MEEKIAKTCSYALLVVMLAIGVVAVATNGTVVLAQPCQVQLGSPNNYGLPYYYGASFQVTVPVSASCSFYAGQLYASGTAYDATYGANLGTTNTVLTSTYGGYGYTGELTFTLPISEQSRSVQFSVSVYGTENGYYGGPYGGLLAQTLTTYVVGPSYYEGYPLYPSYSTPSYPTYSTPSYPTYPVYPVYPTYPSYSYNGGQYYMGGYYNYYHDGTSYNSNYCRTTNHCNQR